MEEKNRALLAYYKQLREQYLKMKTNDKQEEVGASESQTSSYGGKQKRLGGLPGVHHSDLSEENIVQGNRNNAAFTQVFMLCLFTFVFEFLFLVVSYFLFR